MPAGVWVDEACDQVLHTTHVFHTHTKHALHTHTNHVLHTHKETSWWLASKLNGMYKKICKNINCKL